MRSEYREGRLYLLRTSEERQSLLRRLRRIEGQVGGLHQMLEEDRYCGDELQQASAILAAMRAVMQMLLDQHIGAAIDAATDGTLSKADAMHDIEQVIHAALRSR